MHTKMHILLPVEFTCNVIKNDTNIHERGLPFLAARVMFDAEMMVREDTRKAYPEPRFIGYTGLKDA
jgi:uncharacterized DUF497 family protein